MIGEIGGNAELEAADTIRHYISTEPNPKPIVAMVAGRTAPAGKTMGHAGALLAPGDGSAEAKAQALAAAGAIVVAHPGLIGPKLMDLLNRRTSSA